MNNTPKTIKKTAYIVIETNAGYDFRTIDSGGIPYVYFDLEAAKRKLADIVNYWNDGAEEEDVLNFGTNDRDEWANNRYDKSGLIAWKDICGHMDKVEIFQREIDVPMPELTELADAALAYSDAIYDEMDSGDYHLDDFGKTEDEIVTHLENVANAAEKCRELKNLADKYAA